jgi:hypothetical protein
MEERRYSEFFFLVSWLPDKKRRSSPCLRDSVVMPVLIAAPPRCDLLFQLF